VAYSSQNPHFRLYRKRGSEFLAIPSKSDAHKKKLSAPFGGGRQITMLADKRKGRVLLKEKRDQAGDAGEGRCRTPSAPTGGGKGISLGFK